MSIENTTEPVSVTSGSIESSTSAAMAEPADVLLSLNDYAQQALDWLVSYLPNVLAALLIFVIGRFIAKRVENFVRFMLKKGKSDPILIGFLGNLTYYILLTIVCISAIGKLGIQTTSLVAVLGAAGLAVGLALQGSLSNFASGVLILIFRPFKLGDLVEAGGAFGVVQDIGILVTVVNSLDNKKIIVPNSSVMGGNIVNLSANGVRRVDMVFGISYSDDIDKARKIMIEEVNKHAKVLQDPAPQIAVSELGDSSVNFVVRPWANVADYWDVYFGVHEAIKKAFDSQGVCIPFPQRDVHLYQEKA